MPTHWLLVADPPHSDSAKVPEIAARLKLLALEVRGRLGYPIPDPWLVFDAEGPAREAERDLTAIGVSCAAVLAGDLARVPSAVEPDGFELPESGVAWSKRHGPSGLLEWGQVRTAIVYRRVLVEKSSGPSDSEKKIAGTLGRASKVARFMPGGRFLAGKLEGAARDVADSSGSRLNSKFDEVLEVSGVGASGPQRARFVRSELGYTGLGPLLQPVATTNWLTFVKVVTERAKEARVDRRGDKVQARPLMTLDKVGLPKVFASAPDRLQEIASDPLELFGTFVAWRKEVLTPP